MHTTLFGWLKQLLNHLLGSLAGNNPSSAFVQSVGTNTILRLGHNSKLLVEEKEKGGFYSSIPNFHDTPTALSLSKDIMWKNIAVSCPCISISLYTCQGITLYPSIPIQSDSYRFYILYRRPPVVLAEWLSGFCSLQSHIDSQVEVSRISLKDLQALNVFFSNWAFPRSCGRQRWRL